MKICFTISKLGKNVKFMYQKLDEDDNGNLSPEEIIKGLREKFKIYFSKREINDLVIS